MLDYPSQSTIALESLPEKGPAPKSRIGSAQQAREIVANLIHANAERNRQNAKIKGMMDGNRPFNPAALRNAGQSHRANVNFLEGKAAISSAMAPYYDLFTGANYYASIDCDYGDDEDRQRYSFIITEEFDRLLRDFRAFDFRMKSLIYDFVDRKSVV